MKPSRLSFGQITLALGTLALLAPLRAESDYRQKNLVSDLPGLATHTDPNLVNPWGISSGPTSPFWVSNAGTATTTLYNTGGTPLPLVVNIPGAVPTGQVFNGNASAFNGDRFLFASATGTISGWRGALGTTAETLVNNSAAGAAYLGLAVANIGSDSRLYAADFAHNRIDVFGSTGAPESLAGNFMDPNLPAGYSPFNVAHIGGSLFVTYAKVEAGGDEEEAGPGLGLINRFDLNGNLLGRFASNGVLNAPWGVTVAPESFGRFGGNLLVGNFGDGTIHAFDQVSGDLIGTLKDELGNPLVIEGLWGLQFGNGGAGGKLGTLYFAAGIDDETHGLFGSITPVPEPSTIGAVAATGLVAFCVFMRRQRRNRPTETVTA